MPGPLAFFCLTGRTESRWHLSYEACSRGIADREVGIDRFIRPCLPGNALTLELLQGLGLIQLEAATQLLWIGLQLSDQLLEPVVSDRLSQLKGTDQAPHLGEVAGAQTSSELSGPEVALLPQGSEKTRDMAAAANT